jgi:hypothetical protein
VDPGRKKFEERDIEYIAVGDTVVTEAGVKWVVYFLAPRALYCERQTSDKSVYYTFLFSRYKSLRVEVERGPTH